MSNSKTIFKILVILFLVIQYSFAASKPVPRIGIVVKKNNCLPSPCKSTCNHDGGVALITDRLGGFSTQLEEGEYELSFPQNQLQSAINKIIKKDYPESGYQFDGSGVEMALDNSEIRVNLKPIKEKIYAINEQNGIIIIIVPSGGATFSGILSWNYAVLANSISCPEGFVMQNGECVAIANSASENRGIDKKDIKRMNSANINPMYEEKNKEGQNPLYEAQRKGIRENGLKKNAIDVFEEDNTPTQTEGKLKGKIIKGGDNGMISVSDENKETPTTSKGWDGTVKGGTAAQRKGINEKGLKKDDANINTTNLEKKD